MANSWLKLYHETLNDPKMGTMSDHLYRRTIELFLLAGQENRDGLLPPVAQIAWALRTTVNDVTLVLQELCELRIVTKTGGSYIVTHFVERQNSNLSDAERSARYRGKQSASRELSDARHADSVTDESETVTQTVTNPSRNARDENVQTVTVDIDKDIDKDIEEDKELRGRVNAPAPKKPAAQKHQHGSFKNVLLTDAELEKLHERFLDADERIEHFSKKKAAKGYVYKSDYAAILSWAQDKAEQPRASVTIPTAPRRPTNAELITSLELEGLDE